MQYQFSCAPKLARKCEIEHWLYCGADGQLGGGGGGVNGHVITKFLGWVDLLTHSAPQARTSSTRVLRYHFMYSNWVQAKLIAIQSGLTANYSSCLKIYVRARYTAKG